jgi:hypothetical protein
MPTGETYVVSVGTTTSVVYAVSVSAGNVVVTVVVTCGVGRTRQEHAFEIWGAAHSEGMPLGFSIFTSRFWTSSLI